MEGGTSFWDLPLWRAPRPSAFTPTRTAGCSPPAARRRISPPRWNPTTALRRFRRLPAAPPAQAGKSATRPTGNGDSLRRRRCQPRTAKAGPPPTSRTWRALQTCLRFADHRGRACESYPANPNGSPGDATGFTSEDGRLAIMMPHPERVFRATCADGWGEYSLRIRMFRNARGWVR